MNRGCGDPTFHGTFLRRRFGDLHEMSDENAAPRRAFVTEVVLRAPQTWGSGRMPHETTNRGMLGVLAVSLLSSVARPSRSRRGAADIVAPGRQFESWPDYGRCGQTAASFSRNRCPAARRGSSDVWMR